MDKLKKFRIIPLFAIFLAAGLYFNSCAMMKDFFSEAANDANTANVALHQHNYAKYIYYSALGLTRDIEHNGLRKNLAAEIENIVPGIEAQLADGSEENLSDLAEKSALYRYVIDASEIFESQLSQPVFWEETAITISLPDYSEEFSQIMALGTEMTMREGNSFLEEGKFQKSDEAFALGLNTFFKEGTEEYDSLCLKISDLFVEQLNELTDPTGKDLSDVDTLIQYAAKYNNENSKLADFKGEMAATFISLAKIEAGKNKIEFIDAALIFLNTAKKYTAGQSEINALTIQYKDQAAEICYNKAKGLEQRYNYTKTMAQEIINTWEKTLTYNSAYRDAPDKLTDFKSSEQVQAYVFSLGAPESVARNLGSSLDRVLDSPLNISYNSNSSSFYNLREAMDHYAAAESKGLNYLIEVAVSTGTFTPHEQTSTNAETETYVKYKDVPGIEPMDDDMKLALKLAGFIFKNGSETTSDAVGNAIKSYFEEKGIQAIYPNVTVEETIQRKWAEIEYSASYSIMEFRSHNRIEDQSIKDSITGRVSEAVISVNVNYPELRSFFTDRIDGTQAAAPNETSLRNTAAAKAQEWLVDQSAAISQKITSRY